MAGNKDIVNQCEIIQHGTLELALVVSYVDPFSRDMQ